MAREVVDLEVLVEEVLPSSALVVEEMVVSFLLLV